MSGTEPDRVGPVAPEEPRAPEGPGTPVGYGVRLAWADLPASVHDWVGERLGAPVVTSATQPGGFSPGAANRVVTADGARGFVKAASPELNPDTPDVHRREIAALRQMPPGLGVPRLVDSLDDGHWVVLLIEDVEGRHPRTPWVDEEVRATLQALALLQRHFAPERWPALEQELAGEFGSWARIGESAPPDLDPWLAARLGALDALSRATLPQLTGDGVCHTDTRADNLLLTPEGTVRVVDWPWASRGAPWFDAAALLINLELYGGVDATAYLPQVQALGASHTDVLGTVAGLCGFFTEAAIRPPAPGLPTLRAFQRAQAVAATRLLQRLTSQHGGPLP